METPQLYLKKSIWKLVNKSYDLFISSKAISAPIKDIKFLLSSTPFQLVDPLWMLTVIVGTKL